MKSHVHALGFLAALSAITGCGSSGATIGAQPVSPGASPTPRVTLAPGQTPSPTPSPTVPGATPTPTLAPGTTPTPTPTPTPTAAVTGAIYHPGNNGDAFSMAGTLLITYQRPNQYPTPEPTSTTFDNVVQSVAVTNPASFNGVSGVEFAISETDSQTAPATQTFTDTMDEYFQYSNNMVTGNFLNLGYTETDDSGFSATVTNGPNDELADILPETSGKTWSNMAGRTISTSDGHGETSTTTYADDGSYTGTVTYPEQTSPSGMQSNTANLVTKADGSADYKTPRFGESLQYNYEYKIQAPSAPGTSGTIAETTTIPPAVGSTATPEAVATTVANWLPPSVPGALANESDVDNGPVALPSSCPVPSALTGTPNQIVQTKLRVDPLNGELETTTTTTYDSANIGPICVVLDDVQDNYYDFSGQNGTGYFSGAPQQITEIQEVLYLTAETVQTIARHPETRSRYATERAVNVATAQARMAIAHARLRLQMFDANRRGRSYEKSFRSFEGLLK